MRAAAYHRQQHVLDDCHQPVLVRTPPAISSNVLLHESDDTADFADIMLYSCCGDRIAGVVISDVERASRY